MQIFVSEVVTVVLSGSCEEVHPVGNRVKVRTKSSTVCEVSKLKSKHKVVNNVGVKLPQCSSKHVDVCMLL